MQSDIYKRIENHFRENRERLVAFCNKFLNSHDRAEDVVQEAYTRALTYWESVPDEPAEFVPWFQTILNNCIREDWKKEKARGMSITDEEAEEIPVKSSALPTVILKAVEDRIDAKGESAARILRLHFIEGYTAKEISEMVDDTANAIRVMVHRFRQEIKKDYRWVI